MPFRVAARTVLQLGAELISSDGVAFYELIKNAFDARTKRAVRVDVVCRMPFTQWRELKEALRKDDRSPHKDSVPETVRRQALETVDATTPEAEALKSQVR